MINFNRKAEVVEVNPNYSTNDEAFGYTRRYAGHVRVKDECGDDHIFVNGSANQVLDVDIGDKGMVHYHKGGTYSLWYFTKD